MKPKRIILVRHGQSYANTLKKLPAGSAEQIRIINTPDYAVELTPLGKAQAAKAGDTLSKLLAGEKAQFYVSSYRRTRETFMEIAKSLDKSQIQYRDEPRLREQEWGRAFDAEHYESESKLRDAFGHFYFRFMHGESCADVYDRVSSFLDTLHRDFQKEDYPENVVIVGHGMLNRVFLMRWFHWTVEEFELLANPENCGFYILEEHNGKYRLQEEPKKYEKRDHNFQFPIKLHYEDQDIVGGTVTLG